MAKEDLDEFKRKRLNLSLKQPQNFEFPQKELEYSLFDKEVTEHFCKEMKGDNITDLVVKEGRMVQIQFKKSNPEEIDYILPLSILEAELNQSTLDLATMMDKFFKDKP